jgi:hypothetical protein
MKRSITIFASRKVRRLLTPILVDDVIDSALAEIEGWEIGQRSESEIEIEFPLKARRKLRNFFVEMFNTPIGIEAQITLPEEEAEK